MPIPKSNNSKPVQRTLLREKTYDRLREAILDGTLQPGERLVDDEIQEWLGVSRTPIREALTALSRSGFVEMSPNRYTHVAEPVESETKAAVQTLGALLQGVAQLSIPRLADADAATIADQVMQAVDRFHHNDAAGANSITLKMWHSLTEHCGNPLLASIVDDHLDSLAFKLRIPRLHEILDFRLHAKYFEELAEAIRSKDPTKASVAIKKGHLVTED